MNGGEASVFLVSPPPQDASPLNRILSFFPSTFASKLPIYKAGTAGVLGAERLRGLRSSGLAAWGEREEGTAAGVIFLKKKKKNIHWKDGRAKALRQ